MKTKVLIIGFVLLLVAGLVLGVVFMESESRLRVSAASSLSAVIEERLAEAGVLSEVIFKTAGSQEVARQIMAGEDVDVVALAHPDWMEELEKNGFVSSEQRHVFLSNRLVVIASKTLDPPVDNWEEFKEYSGRLATGNVKYVPAGIYARQALESAGLWEKMAENNVGFSNVTFVLRAVESGHIPLGIVYRSDLKRSDSVRRIFDIPLRHTPEITYEIAVMKDSPGSQKIFKLLNDQKAREIYLRHGFSLP